MEGGGEDEEEGGGCSVRLSNTLGCGEGVLCQWSASLSELVSGRLLEEVWLSVR